MVGSGIGMQGAVAVVSMATVSLAIVTPLLLQSFCTGAQTWKFVMVGTVVAPCMVKLAFSDDWASCCSVASVSLGFFTTSALTASVAASVASCSATLASSP